MSLLWASRQTIKPVAPAQCPAQRPATGRGHGTSKSWSLSSLLNIRGLVASLGQRSVTSARVTPAQSEPGLGGFTPPLPTSCPRADGEPGPAVGQESGSGRSWPGPQRAPLLTLRRRGRPRAGYAGTEVAQPQRVADAPRGPLPTRPSRPGPQSASWSFQTHRFLNSGPK